MTAQHPGDSGRLARRIDQARGLAPADLVIRGARLLNTATGRIEGPLDIAVCEDTVVGLGSGYEGSRIIEAGGRIACPGFIDTHVHIESSLVVPAEFERGVLPCGTTTAICDPHEIANVTGIEGVRWFIEAAGPLAMSLFVNLSSCVPATALETSGARLGAADLAPLMDRPEVIGLAEVMNFPGVIFKEEDMLEKLAAFAGRHIDGHAPLLSGADLDAYLACGVLTDHECTTLDEAREKLGKGMNILLREGSIAKNVAALAPLIDEASWMRCAFCTDDRNPLEMREEGHIDAALRKAIACGAPVMPAYRAATLGAATIFGLKDRGMIAPGKRADIVLLDDLEGVAVSEVVCGGRRVKPALFEGRRHPPPVGLDSVKRGEVAAEDLARGTDGPMPVIGALPYSLLTDHLTLDPAREPDIARLCVLERHGVNGNIGRGFVKGFGPLRGAIASSIGHDSHNLIVVGDEVADMALAANRLIALGGGAAVVRRGSVLAEIALPVAGLMTEAPLAAVADALVGLRTACRAIGCQLDEPLLQLAFLPLPVIPHLKLTDLGYVAATATGLKLLDD